MYFPLTFALLPLYDMWRCDEAAYRAWHRYEDTLAVIDRVARPGARNVLVGSSIGAWIALKAAAARREVVQVRTPPPPPPPLPHTQLLLPLLRPPDFCVDRGSVLIMTESCLEEHFAKATSKIARAFISRNPPMVTFPRTHLEKWINSCSMSTILAFWMTIEVDL